MNIKKEYGDKALAVFVMPPNEEALKERLELRGSETEQTLKTRLDKARSEMQLAEQFDEQIVNDDLQDAIDEAKALVFSFLSVE